jgi:hypothetical protein
VNDEDCAALDAVTKRRERRGLRRDQAHAGNSVTSS